MLRNFDCSLEFVFSLLLFQPFNLSPVSFACNFQDWGGAILREIDFLLKICWSIPCLHPSWKVHTWIEICASLNHRKKTKADGSRLIPRKHTETLVLLSVILKKFQIWRFFLNPSAGRWKRCGGPHAARGFVVGPHCFRKQNAVLLFSGYDECNKRCGLKVRVMETLYPVLVANRSRAECQKLLPGQLFQLNSLNWY